MKGWSDNLYNLNFVSSRYDEILPNKEPPETDDVDKRLKWYEIQLKNAFLSMLFLSFNSEPIKYELV